MNDKGDVEGPAEQPGEPRVPANEAEGGEQKEVPPVVSPGTSGDADEGVSVRRVVRTTIACAIVAAVGHSLILIGYLLATFVPGVHPRYIPWEFCVGITVALVGAIAFGGFYAASLRARVAIASSVLLTFLILLSFDLSIAQLARSTGNGEAASNLVSDLRGYVGTVVIFYFGSEAFITAAKAVSVGFGNAANAAAVMTVDRDLARRSEAAKHELDGLVPKTRA